MKSDPVDPRSQAPHTTADPSPFKAVLRWLQVLALVVVLAFIFRALSARWSDVAAAAREVTPQWSWIVLSSAIVLCTYAALIESWRVLIRAGGGQVPYWTAARIWTVANLGRYLPFKVWSIGALGILAQRAGVSAITATGAAILGTLLNIGAGFGVTALSAASARASMPGYMQIGSLVGAILFVVGVLLLPYLMPWLLRLYSRLRGVAVPTREPPVRALWVATAVNVFSWAAYGIAFACFARGVTPTIVGTTMQFITLYTASYIAGYVFLIAPGGLGVREAALTTLMVSFGMASSADAILLSILSRLWLTVLEIAPGLIGLLFLSRRERGASDAKG